MNEHDYVSASADWLAAAALLILAFVTHTWGFALVGIAWAAVGLRQLRIARRAHADSTR